MADFVLILFARFAATALCEHSPRSTVPPRSNFITCAVSPWSELLCLHWTSRWGLRSSLQPRLVPLRLRGDWGGSRVPGRKPPAGGLASQYFNSILLSATFEAFCDYGSIKRLALSCVIRRAESRVRATCGLEAGTPTQLFRLSVRSFRRGKKRRKNCAWVMDSAAESASGAPVRAFSSSGAVPALLAYAARRGKGVLATTTPLATLTAAAFALAAARAVPSFEGARCSPGFREVVFAVWRTLS